MSATDTDRLAAARRALLQQRLRSGRTTRPSTGAVTARTTTDPAPLSISQRQLWYLNQLAPEAIAYNEMVTVRKSGALDADALRRAFTELVRRHHAWRTTFPLIDGEARQVVHAPPSFELTVLDLTHLEPEVAEQRATELAAADTRRPYDLAAGPLLRPRLVRLTPEDHRLYLGLHHLVFDGVSLYRVVLPELVALYQAYSAGLPSPLPEPVLQYPDYAAWEVEWTASAAVAARVRHWRERLAGAPPLQFPLEHPRPARQEFRGGMVALSVRADTVARLRSFAQHHDASLFQVLAAAYAWWLHRYTGQPDLVFATATDLRQRPELDSLVGYCLTPMPIRVDLDDVPTLSAVLGRVRAEILDGLGKLVPFEHLVRELDVPRDPRLNPLFQTVLVLEPPLAAPDPEWSLHQMESAIGNQVGSSKFDLSLELDERPDGHLAGRFVYDSELFERSSAEQMGRHWTRFLGALAQSPELPLEALDRPDPAEQHRQLVQWNPPPSPEVAGRCVHELILEQAAWTPDAVAVVCGAQQLTYRELVTHARSVAERLVAAGAKPGTIVAALLDRSCEQVVGLLGILIAGAAYLPIDPRQPARRTQYMITDSGAMLLLTRTALLTDLPAVDAIVCVVDADHEATTSPVTRAASPSDLAYLMYTSGSTGAPKGVLVEHRNVAYIMATLLQQYGVTASDAVLTVASYTFDVSVGDIFGALGLGARVVLASAEQTTDPHALAALIDQSGATFVSATPTTWSALLSAGWAGSLMVTAVTAGEPVPESLARDLIERCAAVWNGYGPTEATVVASCGRLLGGEPVTVGRPLPGGRVYVLDDQGRLLPSGVPGEIVLAGAGVARGYLNRPTETTARFGADPFVEGGRVYRTGDRGRFLADGRVQHLGRLDDQVKVRGFRVEPGEIEAVLREHPAVAACAVTAQENAQGERELVAHVVGTGVSDVQLRAWVRARLPDYMVPTTIVGIEQLPVTPSGKLNRRALPEQESEHDVAPRGQAPRTPTEERVADLWSAVLHRDVTDVHADFFDLGGHSLLAARLIHQTEAQFARRLTLSEFLQHGTIAGLAALLARAPTTDTVERTDRPILFFVYPDLSSAMSSRHLVGVWGDEQQMVPFVAPQTNGRFDVPGGVEGLVKPLIDLIRHEQPNGPYRLAGFSLGGLLVYDIARQLAKAGDEVEWLGVLDSPTPAIATSSLRGLTRWGWLTSLRTLDREERRARYRDAAQRAVRRLQRAPSTEDTEEFVYRDAFEIAHSYTQPGHAVPVDLFVTEDSIEEVGDATLGWGRYHRGPLRIHQLPGHHDALLDQPRVRDVARLLLASIRGTG